MDDAVNLPLAARLAELGMTQTELADALNDAIERSNGRPGTLSDRHVRRLLSGEIRWPWPATRTALEEVLGTPTTQLGFTPHRTSSTGQETGVTSNTTVDATGEDVMDRRDVLGIVGGLVISVAVPALPRTGRLGMSDVDRLRRPLLELFGHDDRLGGVALADAARRQAARITNAIERYETSERVSAALHGLAGEYLAAAGWFSIDADDLPRATGYLDRALRAASIAKDFTLQAQVWNCLAMHARQANAHAASHAAARAGLASTAARRDPRIAALFHARMAHSHAFRGELSRTERSLDRARAALDRATDDAPIPTWLLFLDHAELAGLSAMAYNTLGRYTPAVDQALLDLALLPGGYVRNRTHCVLHLAWARLGQHDIEQATVHATDALHMATHLRGGLHTGRVATRLRLIHTRLTRHLDVPAARTWADAYTTATTTPA